MRCARLAQIRADADQLHAVQLQFQLAGVLLQRSVAFDIERAALRQLGAHIERGRTAQRTHANVAVEVFQYQVGSRLRGRVTPVDGAVGQLKLVDRHIQRFRLCGGRGLGRGSFRFGRCRLAGELREIDRSIRTARGINAHAIQRQRIEAEYVVERAHVGKRCAHLFGRHQWRFPGVDNFQVVEAGRAMHAQHRRAALGLLELDRQVGRQLALWHCHRKRSGYVAEVAGQIQTVDLDVEVRFERLGKRLCLACEMQRRTVDARGQQRLHEDVHVSGQARQERHAYLQSVHLVLCTKRLVGKIDRAVGQLQIGKDETCRLVRLGLGRGFRLA